MEFLNTKSLMKNFSRKKFLFAGISLATTTFLLKWRTKPEKKGTVKFLTQEGKLVEVEIDKLPNAKKLASKEDLQHWIKK